MCEKKCGNCDWREAIKKRVASMVDQLKTQ